MFLPFPRHLVTVNVFSLVFLRFTVEHNRMRPRVRQVHSQAHRTSSSKVEGAPPPRWKCTSSKVEGAPPPRWKHLLQGGSAPNALLLTDGSEGEALDGEVTGVLVVPPAARPPRNVLASACSRSWRSLESRGRCRRPGRGGRLACCRTMGLGSEELVALYTPENTAAG